MDIEDISDAAVFLDMDGTLIDSAPTPDSVIVPPALVPLLQGLEKHLSGACSLQLPGECGQVARKTLDPPGLDMSQRRPGIACAMVMRGTTSRAAQARVIS